MSDSTSEKVPAFVLAFLGWAFLLACIIFWFFTARENAGPYEFHATSNGLIWRCNRKTGDVHWGMPVEQGPQAGWHFVARDLTNYTVITHE